MAARITAALSVVLLLSFCSTATAGITGHLLVGNDQTNATIWQVDETGMSAATARVTTNAVTWGMAFDPLSDTLYWNNGGSLFKAAYTPSGLLTPMLIGTLNIGGSNTNVTGMAFNETTNKLYGYRSISAPGFYEINPANASMTAVFLTPSGSDFGGFDYDPVTNSFYGLNDGTALSGRGLYKMGADISNPSFSLLTPYPGGETDIDGLAVGSNGKAYMVNDVPSQGIYVFDLGSSTYDPTLASPFTGNGIFASATWIPEPATMCLLLGGLFGLRRRHR